MYVEDALENIAGVESLKPHTCTARAAVRCVVGAAKTQVQQDATAKLVKVPDRRSVLSGAPGYRVFHIRICAPPPDLCCNLPF